MFEHMYYVNEYFIIYWMLCHEATSCLMLHIIQVEERIYSSKRGMKGLCSQLSRNYTIMIANLFTYQYDHYCKAVSAAIYINFLDITRGDS